MGRAKDFPSLRAKVRVDFGSRLSFKELPHVFLRWGLKKQAATVKCCCVVILEIFSCNKKKHMKFWVQGCRIPTRRIPDEDVSGGMGMGMVLQGAC